MDLGTLVGIVVASGGGLWALWQLWHGIFGKYARKEDVSVMRADVDAIRATMVTRDDFAKHEERDQKDRDERRETEIKLFDRFDSLKDDMNSKFDSLKDLIVARLK